jgi:WD40 repeat protein
MPVKIFFCYAHEDEALLNKLKTHLKPLQRKGLIDVWYDRDISAGTEWEKQIKEQLNAAQIILLLVSPDFMDSDYCYGIEMQRALKRHDLGEARVIPIILRHVYWQEVLGNLQALPTDAKPIKSWPDLDEAFFNVTEGIRKVVMQLTVPPTFASSAIPVEMLQENPFLSPPVLKPVSKQRWNVFPFLSPLAVEKLALLYTLKHISKVLSVALSADGQTLVSGSDDSTIKVWNLASGQELRTLKGHTFMAFKSVALSADEQTLVGGSSFGEIYVWNLASGQELRTLKGPIYYFVWSVALSADGQTLVSASMNQPIKVWNLATGREVRTLTNHEEEAYSVALSADGQTLVSGSDNTIKVWNLASGQELRTLKGHTGFVWSVALSADGQTLVSGSVDNTIKVWNLASGQELRTLKGHADHVTSVALSADGQTLVSGSYDGTIKVWNLASGQELRTLKGHADHVTSVALSADGQTLVSGSEDGTIKVWRA